MEENDFGSVTLDGEKVFWKIDYYADEKHGLQGTEDTLNSYQSFDYNVRRRVLI